jgi:hypothetical protein
MLKPIERALTRNSLAVRLYHRFELPGQNGKSRILAKLVMLVELLESEHQPNTCWLTGVPTLCSTNLGARRSVKQRADRRISPRPRSNCPSSSVPAFDVIVLPSNSATTARPSTASNSNSFGVHSVCIGVLRETAQLFEK